MPRNEHHEAPKLEAQIAAAVEVTPEGSRNGAGVEEPCRVDGPRAEEVDCESAGGAA